MFNEIQTKLAEIAIKYNIKILYACESGSRAWGFPSPDSDYDVRFIYVQETQKYTSIAGIVDNLSFSIEDDLDIYGWDIKKVLQLIYKSNTTPFEWLQSPVIYYESTGFREKLFQICSSYFNQKRNILHYLGVAHSAKMTIKNESEIKIKKLFYILRPILAAKWNYEKNSIAPMNIEPLLDLVPLPIQQKIKDLIEFKTQAIEGQLITIMPDLIAFISSQSEFLSREASRLEESRDDVRALDLFFHSIIFNNEYTDPKGTKPDTI